MEAAAMTRIDLTALITAVADTIAAHADELTALDQAIGDGDHGLNMKRGFEAVRAESATLAEKPLPEALKAIGTKLVMTVGGASGPLYGTLFMSARQGTCPPSPAAPTWRRRSRSRSTRSPRAANRRPARRPCSTCSIRCRRRSRRARARVTSRTQRMQRPKRPSP